MNTHYVRTDAETSQFFDAILSRLGLVFSVLDRYQTHVNAAKVVTLNSELKLSKGLDEGHALDISYRSAELKNKKNDTDQSYWSNVTCHSNLPQ